MCVRVHVCMCPCVDVYMCVHMHVCENVCMQMCDCVFVCVCTCKLKLNHRHELLHTKLLSKSKVLGSWTWGEHTIPQVIVMILHLMVGGILM